MKRAGKAKTKAQAVDVPIAPEDFPTLSEFFSAYLHQDFRNEYGSAIKAAKHYVSDAAPGQVQALRAEWQRFREKLTGQSLVTIQAAVRKLGAAWLPDSDAAFIALDATLK
ncbi:MAG TPA: contact-dependent growth inhibition system immunity protein [Candidatus Acidoferrum sp.]|jgi:hypothetical protein